MNSGCCCWPPGACPNTGARETESTRKASRIKATVAFMGGIISQRHWPGVCKAGAMKGGATKAWQLIFDGECRNMSGRVRASCWGAANGASVKVKAMRVAVLAATVAAMCLYASATTAQEKKAKPAQDAKAKSPAAASEQKKAPK